MSCWGWRCKREVAKGPEMWGWGQVQKQGHRREPASCSQFSYGGDAGLGPSIWARPSQRGNKEEEEEDHFLPTSWAKGPSERNFYKDELCLCCSPPSMPVSLPQFRSSNTTCTTCSYRLLVAPCAVWVNSSHKSPCPPPSPQLAATSRSVRGP